MFITRSDSLEVATYYLFDISLISPEESLVLNHQQAAASMRYMPLRFMKNFIKSAAA